jgi:uncharacterized membrane protein YozB (DUF420 family)
MKFNIDKERLVIAVSLCSAALYLTGIPALITIYGIENNLEAFKNSKGVHESIGPVTLSWWGMNFLMACIIYLMVEIKKIFFAK